MENDGPGVVDWEEPIAWNRAISQKINKMRMGPIRSDLNKMVKNALQAHRKYGDKSLYYKKHQEVEYQKWLEARKHVEKMITWATLRSPRK